MNKQYKKIIMYMFMFSLFISNKDIQAVEEDNLNIVIEDKEEILDNSIDFETTEKSKEKVNIEIKSNDYINLGSYIKNDFIIKEGFKEIDYNKELKNKMLKDELIVNKETITSISTDIPKEIVLEDNEVEIIINLESLREEIKEINFKNKQLTIKEVLDFDFLTSNFENKENVFIYINNKDLNNKNLNIKDVLENIDDNMNIHIKYYIDNTLYNVKHNINTDILLKNDKEYLNNKTVDGFKESIKKDLIILLQIDNKGLGSDYLDISKDIDLIKEIKSVRRTDNSILFDVRTKYKNLDKTQNIEIKLKETPKEEQITNDNKINIKQIYNSNKTNNIFNNELIKKTNSIKKEKDYLLDNKLENIINNEYSNLFTVVENDSNSNFDELYPYTLMEKTNALIKEIYEVEYNNKTYFVYYTNIFHSNKTELIENISLDSYIKKEILPVNYYKLDKETNTLTKIEKEYINKNKLRYVNQSLINSIETIDTIRPIDFTFKGIPETKYHINLYEEGSFLTNIFSETYKTKQVVKTDKYGIGEFRLDIEDIETIEAKNLNMEIQTKGKNLRKIDKKDLSEIVRKDFDKLYLGDFGGVNSDSIVNIETITTLDTIEINPEAIETIGFITDFELGKELTLKLKNPIGAEIRTKDAGFNITSENPEWFIDLDSKLRGTSEVELIEKDIETGNIKKYVYKINFNENNPTNIEYIKLLKK